MYQILPIKCCLIFYVEFIESIPFSIFHLHVSPEVWPDILCDHGSEKGARWGKIRIWVFVIFRSAFLIYEKFELKFIYDLYSTFIVGHLVNFNLAHDYCNIDLAPVPWHKTGPDILVTTAQKRGPDEEKSEFEFLSFSVL
jgi:hypothetical protein